MSTYYIFSEAFGYRTCFSSADSIFTAVLEMLACEHGRENSSVAFLGLLSGWVIFFLVLVVSSQIYEITQLLNLTPTRAKIPSSASDEIATTVLAFEQMNTSLASINTMWYD